MLRFSLFLFAALILAACTPAREVAQEMTGPPPRPEVPREFRAAWIATVDNIDWPSRPGLSTAEQQAELRSLLDRLARLNFNAVILQVRPTADAFYASRYEPWSAYLTGQQGIAPEPYYDPLTFAIAEAHKRGLELHAWFNPYRAYHPTNPGELDVSHIQFTNPDVVKAYGDLLWMDPSEPVVQQRSLDVILDVVERYDVDGVHLDDYFYPYPKSDSLGAEIPFPDSTSWARAQATDPALDQGDWRRQSVDGFVERLYREVKAAKPHVKVGISPFGIWRPGYPETVVGFDAYARLYADARRWQQEGWVDYLAPQLYWAIDKEGQRYNELLEWWASQNTAGRHLWPGNYTSRLLFDTWEPAEIVEQIRLTRANGVTDGNIHFSAKVLRDTSSTMGPALMEEVYAGPALIPASPWLDSIAPAAPMLTTERLPDGTMLTMLPGDDEPVWLWVVQQRHGATWDTDVLPAWQQSAYIGKGNECAAEVAVQAVDRLGNASTIRSINRPCDAGTAELLSR
ncbi:MAG: family 10 glycosylhydrolase [Bacteroidota bacterium]